MTVWLLFLFDMIGLKDIFRKKTVQMRDVVTHVERDAGGNIWYLSSFFGKRSGWKTDYNMAVPQDKAGALSACTPLFVVLDKLGSMMGRCQVYVVDKGGNEKRTYASVRERLRNPNPLQTFTAFIKQVEINLRLFGYCPLSVVRGFKGGEVKALWVLPPEYFHLEGTGNFVFQDNPEAVVKSAYLQWGGHRVYLEPHEYILIHDGSMIVSDREGGDIIFPTASDSLSRPVSNWIAAMSARHTLIVNGGPKGIVCGGKTDAMENTAISPDEEDSIRNKFKQKYGLVGKDYPVLVTRHQLSWLPMDFNADQLKLHEEDDRCTASIANALGLNPNLFSDAKYDNQESAKKSAYQDVVIPDSAKIAEALTTSICPDGAFIKLDFSGVECLQANKNLEATTLVHVADGLSKLYSGGFITDEELRKELSRYMDIDPGHPAGEFVNQTNGGNEDEQV